jgi:hypothetical protein
MIICSPIISQGARKAQINLLGEAISILRAPEIPKFYNLSPDSTALKPSGLIRRGLQITPLYVV